MRQSIRESWWGVTAVVSGGHFLSHFYILTLPPLFPLLGAEFGYSNTELGLIISVLSAGGLLQAPIGKLVDRVGAKWVFVSGICVTAAGLGLVGVEASYPALLLFAGISGVGQSAFHPAGYTILNRVTAPDVQGRAFSVHTFSGFAGFAAAPIVVGSLGEQFGWRETLLLVSSVGIGYTVLAAVVLAPVALKSAATDREISRMETSRQPAQSTLRYSSILGLAGFFLVTALASRGIQTFTTLLAVNSFEFGNSMGNTLLTVFFATGALGVLAGGILADRYPPGRIIAGTLGVGASALLVTVMGGVPRTVVSMVFMFGLMGFFISLMIPSRDRLVSRLSGPASVGQNFGIAFTGATIGALIGPVFLGVVGDATSISIIFLVIGGIYLAAGFCAIVFS